MKKKLSKIDLYGILNWYADFKTKPQTLPVSIEWDLFKNIKVIQTDGLEFIEFRENLIKKIQSEFFNEEKSTEKDGVQTVKEEFKPDYEKKVKEGNKLLHKIGAEEKEYDLRTIDVDSFIKKIPDDSKLNTEDFEMLSKFSEEKSE